MHFLNHKYPTQYIVIWCLILLFILFSIVVFNLIFIHRFTQDYYEKTNKIWLDKIEGLLTYIIIEKETDLSIIVNEYNNTVPKKLQNKISFKQLLLATSISLIDKLEGSSKNSILQIIEALDLKKIIYKNIKTKNYLTKMIGLNELQVLQLSAENLKLNSSKKNIINKYNELIFSDHLNSVNKNIIYNDWQKSFILYFLQHNKTKHLPNFSILLQPNYNIEIKQFAVELIYLFGQIESSDLLLNCLHEINFNDEKNNSFIGALITACSYFDENACKLILLQKNETNDVEINLKIKRILTSTNIA